MTSVATGAPMFVPVPRSPIPPSHLNSPSEPARRFRLMEVVRRVLAEQRYSARTCEAYTAWIRRYILHYGRRHPADLDVEHVAGFLSDLAVRQTVSASTQNQALAALLFLYVRVLHRPLPRIRYQARPSAAACAGRVDARRGAADVGEARGSGPAGCVTLVRQRATDPRVRFASDQGCRCGATRDHRSKWEGRQGSARAVGGCGDSGYAAVSADRV
jgi:hypothetical protein